MEDEDKSEDEDEGEDEDKSEDEDKGEDESEAIKEEEDDEKAEEGDPADYIGEDVNDYDDDDDSGTSETDNPDGDNSGEIGMDQVISLYRCVKRKLRNEQLRISDLQSALETGELCGAAPEKVVNKVVKIMTQILYPTVKVKVSGGGGLYKLGKFKLNKFLCWLSNGKDTKSCSKAEELKSKKVESLSPKLASLSSEKQAKKKSAS